MPKHLIKTGKSISLSGPHKLVPKDAYVELHGGAAKLTQAGFSGGTDSSTAVNAFKGALDWQGGGTSGVIGKYLIYAGEILRGDDWIGKLYLRNVTAQHGNKHEAVIRLMGAQGMATRLLLNVVAPDWRAREKRAQCGQFRHARFIVSDSNWNGSLANGQLAPWDTSRAQMDKYESFADRFPTYLVFDRCVGTGGVCDAGKMMALYRGVTIEGKDPRGVDGDTCFSHKFFKTKFGAHAPTTLLVGVKVHGFKRLAVDNVIVGPDCWLNGSRVPAEINAAQAKALADRIEAGALGGYR